MINTSYHEKVKALARELQRKHIKNETEDLGVEDKLHGSMPLRTVSFKLVGLPQKEYKKQVPKIEGGNMEIQDDYRDKLARNYGGSKTKQPKKTKQEGGSLPIGFMSMKRPKAIGGAKETKKAEIVQGSIIDLIPEEKPEKSTLTKMQRRQNIIKKIMKSKKISMIGASKYIKDNNIKY